MHLSSALHTSGLPSCSFQCFPGAEIEASPARAKRICPNKDPAIGSWKRGTEIGKMFGHLCNCFLTWCILGPWAIYAMLFLCFRLKFHCVGFSCCVGWPAAARTGGREGCKSTRAEGKGRAAAWFLVLTRKMNLFAADVTQLDISHGERCSPSYWGRNFGWHPWQQRCTMRSERPFLHREQEFYLIQSQNCFANFDLMAWFFMVSMLYS